MLLTSSRSQDHLYVHQKTCFFIYSFWFIYMFKINCIIKTTACKKRICKVPICACEDILERPIKCGWEVPEWKQWRGLYKYVPVSWPVGHEPGGVLVPLFVSWIWYQGVISTYLLRFTHKYNQRRGRKLKQWQMNLAEL